MAEQPDIKSAVRAELERRGVILPKEEKPHHGEHLMHIADAIKAVSNRADKRAEQTLTAIKSLAAAVSAQAKSIDSIAQAVAQSGKPVAEALAAQNKALADIAEALTVIAAEETKPEKPEKKEKVRFSFLFDGDEPVGIEQD